MGFIHWTSHGTSRVNLWWVKPDWLMLGHLPLWIPPFITEVGLDKSDQAEHPELNYQFSSIYIIYIHLLTGLDIHEFWNSSLAVSQPPQMTISGKIPIQLSPQMHLPWPKCPDWKSSGHPWPWHRHWNIRRWRHPSRGLRCSESDQLQPGTAQMTMGMPLGNSSVYCFFGMKKRGMLRMFMPTSFTWRRDQLLNI